MRPRPRAFYSPVVIHFTSVFSISAIALVPTHRTIVFAALIGATALIGTLVSAVVTVQLVRRNWTQYLEDYLAYGLLPAIGYLTLAAAAVMIFTETHYAFDVLAGGLLLLLIVNIRNVWDLMLSMVRRQAEALVERRHFHLRPSLHVAQHLRAAERLGEYVAQVGEPAARHQCAVHDGDCE